MHKHFDTSTVRESDRFAFWHEELCRNFCRADSIQVRSEPFDARLTKSELGSISVSSIDCEPMRYQRAPGDICISPSEDFLLSVLTGGVGQIEQQGRTSLLREGDVVMYDTAQPFVYEFANRYRMVLLKVPRRAMLARAPDAEHRTALAISGRTPLGGLAGTMIRSAAELDLEDGVAAARIGASIIDVIAAAMDVSFADTAPTAGRQASLLFKAQAYIRSHLDDADLGVERIAAAMHVSSSTLARLFACSGTTVMRWLWDERLSAAHRALLEGRAKQVTEVALSCGFSSFSHFSRSFKARYGHSPNTMIKPARARSH